MLFGTYQPIFRAGCDEVLRKSVYDTYKAIGGITVPFDEFGTDWNTYGEGSRRADDVAAIGIDPLWCFPCPDPGEAYVHSCACSPNAPDLFFLLDTEDYIRIDRLKWEDAVRTGHSYPEDLKRCVADPGLDDACCDFLVPMDALRNFRCACMVMPEYEIFVESGKGFRFFTPGECRPVIADQFEAAIPGFKSALRKTSAVFRRFGGCTFSMPDSADISGKELEYLCMSRCYKLRFENVLLPALVSLNESGFAGLETCEFFRTAMLADGIRNACGCMSAWSESDRSLDGYATALERFRALRCEEDALILAWAVDRLPSRNDRCPCGSGRKFKKCCGKRYNIG